MDLYGSVDCMAEGVRVDTQARTSNPINGYTASSRSRSLETVKIVWIAGMEPDAIVRRWATRNINRAGMFGNVRLGRDSTNGKRTTDHWPSAIIDLKGVDMFIFCGKRHDNLGSFDLLYSTTLYTRRHSGCQSIPRDGISTADELACTSFWSRNEELRLNSFQSLTVIRCAPC